jgi:hypothetical protein
MTPRTAIARIANALATGMKALRHRGGDVQGKAMIVEGSGG